MSRAFPSPKIKPSAPSSMLGIPQKTRRKEISARRMAPQPSCAFRRASISVGTTTTYSNSKPTPVRKHDCFGLQLLGKHRLARGRGQVLPLRKGSLLRPPAEVAAAVVAVAAVFPVAQEDLVALVEG